MDIGAILSKIKGNMFLISEERFDSLTRDSGYGDSFWHLVACLAVSLPISIFFGLIMQIVSGAGTSAALFKTGLLIALTVACIPLMYIGFGILHMFLKLVGGKAPYEKTAQLLIYGYTPYNLFSGIPILNFAFVLVSLVNAVRGAKRVHQISLVRAAIALVVIPISVAFVVVVLAFIALLPFFMAAAPTITPLQ